MKHVELESIHKAIMNITGLDVDIVHGVEDRVVIRQIIGTIEQAAMESSQTPLHIIQMIEKMIMDSKTFKNHMNSYVEANTYLAKENEELKKYKIFFDLYKDLKS